MQKKRETNVIITSVKEDSRNDFQKVQEIFEAAECKDVVPLKVQRLGKQAEEDNGRIRPLLVVTDSVTSSTVVVVCTSKPPPIL